MPFYCFILGALAQDCVQQGHAQFVNEIVDSFGTITEKYLASWIAKQGGWVSVLGKLIRSITDLGERCYQYVIPLPTPYPEGKIYIWEITNFFIYKSL